MENNNRIFKAVLALVAILVAAGYGLVFYLKLDEPVFFHHYYDQMIRMDRDHYQEISFKLGYITDADDYRVVKTVEFTEYPELNVNVSEDGFMHNFNWGFGKNDNLGDIYGRYNVRTVFCQINEFPNGKDLDGMVLTTAKVLFDDLSEMIVDIGEIYLYKHEQSESPLKFVSTSGSSSGISRTNYRVLKNITLVDIESSLMEKNQNRIELKINGSYPDDVEKITLQEGEPLNVTSKVDTADNIIEKYTYFEIHPKLIFIGNDGSRYYQRVYNINNIYHNYSFTDLYRYIKAREAI